MLMVDDLSTLANGEHTDSVSNNAEDAISSLLVIAGVFRNNAITTSKSLNGHKHNALIIASYLYHGHSCNFRDLVSLLDISYLAVCDIIHAMSKLGLLTVGDNGLCVLSDKGRWWIETYLRVTKKYGQWSMPPIDNDGKE